MYDYHIYIYILYKKVPAVFDSGCGLRANYFYCISIKNLK